MLNLWIGLTRNFADDPLFIITFFSLLIVSCDKSNGADDTETPLHKKDQNTEVTAYFPKADGSFRIVTYNVGSFSKYLDNSTSMVADMMAEVKADIVGMNEVDSVNTRHFTNQALDLAAKMGTNWSWHFGRAMAYKNGAYGNAVITKDKIINKYTVKLDKGPGAEQRSLAVIETEKYIFGAAHLDHTSDEAQVKQAEIINKWAATQNKEKPIFFAGDMNAYPDSRTLSYIRTNWDVISSMGNTFTSSSPKNCIDYIFHYKPSKAVDVVGTDVLNRFAKGDPSKASDHLPVYVDIRFK